MQLSKTHIEILEGIQGKLRRGDITRIAEKTKFTPEYVGMVLNKDSEHFNEKIIDVAIKVIAKREQSTKNLLEKLSAVA